MPPNTIWHAADENMITDGSTMLPVPRRIATSVFITQISTMLEKKICENASASTRTALRPPIQVNSCSPNTSSSTVKVMPTLMAIAKACSASVDARSRSPAPSARAIAEATPPPIAPPDIVIIRMIRGNISAIAASGAMPRRPT